MAKTKRKKDLKELSGLEHTVMQVVWAQGASTADQVREALKLRRPLQDSTVRTILRRLEEGGFVNHAVEGRAYVYRPQVQPQEVVGQTMRRILDRFCGGSLETFLIGLLDEELVSEEELRELTEKVAGAGRKKGEHHV